MQAGPLNRRLCAIAVRIQKPAFGWAMLLMGREVLNASLDKQCVERCRSMWLLWHREYEGGNLIPMSIFRMVDERLDIVVRMRLRGRTSRSKRVLSLVSWSSL